LPVNYQWRFNGVNIPDATNSILTITNVQFSNEGIYDVVVWDSFRQRVSQSAALYVLINPTIVLTPATSYVVKGGTITFSVIYTGNPPFFTNEWRKLTTIIATQYTTNYVSFYQITNAQPSDAGNYRFVVRNPARPTGIASAYFSLVVLDDNDGDGIADIWETQYGLNTNDLSDAMIDSDGDGMSNLEEYIAGTNPLDTESVLEIKPIGGSENAAILGFNAMSNITYTIEYKNSFASPTWTVLTNLPALRTNYTFTFTDYDDKTARFYRIKTPVIP